MAGFRPNRTMRAAIIEAPGRITVRDRPYPVVAESTDAVVRVVLTCVCGGDLWQYRGESPFEPGPIGHEFIGVVPQGHGWRPEISQGASAGSVCPLPTPDFNKLESERFDLGKDSVECGLVREPTGEHRLAAILPG